MASPLQSFLRSCFASLELEVRVRQPGCGFVSPIADFASATSHHRRRRLLT